MAANPFTISGMRTSAQTPAQLQAAREENLHHVFQQAQNALQQEQIQKLEDTIRTLKRTLTTVKQENSELQKNLASKKRELEDYLVFYKKEHEERGEVMRENIQLQVKLAKWLELINEQQQKIDAQKQEIEAGRVIK
jgi:chromosome segregation ATPase